jgi:hypothetical protein
MNLRLILLILVAIQIALLATFSGQVRRLRAPIPVNRPIRRAKPAPEAQPLPNRMPDRAIPFHWSQLESSDYQQYRDNLRAVGCPEATLRDILVADVERLYAQRWAETNLVAVGNFWQRGRKQAGLERQKRRQFGALLEEKREVLRTLLGVMVDGPGLHLWWGDEIAPVFVSHLPEEKAVQTLSIARYYMTRIEEVDRLDQGVSTPEDQEEKERYLALCRQELGQILDGEESMELELRVTLALAMIQNYSTLEPRSEGYFCFTGPELRSLIQSLRGLANPLQQWISWTRDAPRSDEAIEGVMKTEIRKLVGESRYQRYQRALDHAFGGIYDFAQEHSLPDSTAEKVDDLRRQAEEQVGRLSSEKGTSKEDRMAALLELRTGVESQVQGALGSSLFQLYAQQRGSWVTNLANPGRLQ